MDIIGQYIPQFGSYDVPSIVRCQRPISALSRWAPGGRFHSGSQLTLQLKQPIATRRDMEDIGRPWMDVKLYETHWNYHFQGSKTTRYPLTLYILTPRYILEWLWMASDASQEVDGPPPRTLVKDLDFKLQAGERWAILGPNGSGKSTIARTLLERWEPWQKIIGGYCTFGVCWGKLLEHVRSSTSTEEKAHGASTAYVSFDLQRQVLQAGIHKNQGE